MVEIFKFKEDDVVYCELIDTCFKFLHYATEEDLLNVENVSFIKKNENMSSLSKLYLINGIK